MTKNILFITADQWRAECLSCLGHMVQTPNLDALAAEGVLFTNHFANAAPCGPSRASIHTGMYLQNHRVSGNGTPLEARHTNWAIESRKQGFVPALFGYTDTALDPRESFSADSDFRIFDGVLPGMEPVVQLGKLLESGPHAWAEWLRTQGYPIPADSNALYTTKKAQPEWEDGGSEAAPLEIPAELHDTYFMVDQVLDYIKDNQNWCVHLSLLRPHPPWVAPEPYNRMYPPDDLPSFSRSKDLESERSQHPYLDFLLRQQYFRCPDDEKKLRRLQSSYFGLMTEVDHNLGRLFDALKASGEWSNTLIIFSSDHGEQIGDHWLIGKLGYFDQSYAIPLIVYNPDSIANEHRGTRIHQFTENVDLMSTILDWLDLEIPLQCDGRSLLSATEAGQLPASWRSKAHWEFDFSGTQSESSLGLSQRECKLNVLRSETLKYVHFPTLPPLLFDLKKDPHETENVANNPNYSAEMIQSATDMVSWRMLHDDPSLTHLAMTDEGVVDRSIPPQR